MGIFTTEESEIRVVAGQASGGRRDGMPMAVVQIPVAKGHEYITGDEDEDERRLTWGMPIAVAEELIEKLKIVIEHNKES